MKILLHLIGVSFVNVFHSKLIENLEVFIADFDTFRDELFNVQNDIRIDIFVCVDKQIDKQTIRQTDRQSSSCCRRGDRCRRYCSMGAGQPVGPFIMTANWPGQFQLEKSVSILVCQISLFTLLIHGSISHSQQATHLRAAANHHDAGEDDGGVHATHLEAHQHALPAAHASRPDVHPRPAGTRAGLPRCHQA